MSGILKWSSYPYLHSKFIVYRPVVVVVVLVFLKVKYFCSWLKQIKTSILDNILLKLLYTILLI